MMALIALHHATASMIDQPLPCAPSAQIGSAASKQHHRGARFPMTQRR